MHLKAGCRLQSLHLQPYACSHIAKRILSTPLPPQLQKLPKRGELGPRKLRANLDGVKGRRLEIQPKTIDIGMRLCYSAVIPQSLVLRSLALG